jgi:aspartyl-tRNA(Asn)/glutamyl-tRNA(Gln) amidotransferase subunit A
MWRSCTTSCRPDPLDPLTLGHPEADPTTALERGVRGLRLARLPAAERQGVAAEVLHAYDGSLALLAGLGAEIVDIALPFALAEFVSMNNVTMAEAYFANSAVVDDPDSKMDDVVRSRMLTGAAVSAHDYLATLHRRVRMKLEMEAALAGTHAFLTPSTETAAIPLAEIDYKQQPTRFARFVNLLDMCALALPSGFTATGLPTSLQIACRGYEEALALRIGHAYQQASEWHERLPPAAPASSRRSDP